MRYEIILITTLLLFGQIPQTGADYRIEEIAVLEGVISTEVMGANTTVIPIQNFEYLPGWVIYYEYRLTTNTSSYFTDVTYANTMKFRTQHGTLISNIPRIELTNNSYTNGLHSPDLLGDLKIAVYLSAEIIPDTRFGSLVTIDYRLVILDRNEPVELDETESYTGEINHYPESVNFVSSFVRLSSDDINLIMPEFKAKNESVLPDNYFYIMDITFIFTVELYGEGDADFRFTVPPFSNEGRIDASESGQYEVTLEDMDNRKYQRLSIYHDGVDAKITVDSVIIDIPALVDVPESLITPLSLKISATIVAVILFLLPYKMTSSYGSRKNIRAREDLI